MKAVVTSIVTRQVRQMRMTQCPTLSILQQYRLTTPCVNRMNAISTINIGKSSSSFTHHANYMAAKTVSLSAILKMPQPQQLSLLQQHNQFQIRTMGSSNKQSKNQKNKAKQKSTIKKQKIQQQQQKLLAQQRKQGIIVSSNDDATNTSSSEEKKLDQHEQWVEFQKSIAVDGFETGQTLTVNEKGKRGGKAASKKRLTKRDEVFMKIKERQRLAGGGGGEFPPMRYSEEETERLLLQAYAAIPKRTGRRGTLNLKRQKRRWHLVKEIRRKYKNHIIANHFRVLEKRKVKFQKVINFIRNEAPIAVQQDAAYQQMVRERYMAMMESAAKAAAMEHDASTTSSDEVTETFQQHVSTTA